MENPAMQGRRQRSRNKSNKEVNLYYPEAGALKCEKAIVSEISESGLSFKTLAPLELPDKVRIEIPSSSTEEKFKIHAKVTWRDQSNTTFGVLFQNISDARVSVIRSFFVDDVSEVISRLPDRRKTDRRHEVQELKKELHKNNQLFSRIRKQLKNRVAITGVGILSALGSDISLFWKNVKEGNSGISQLDILGYSTSQDAQIGARLNSFDPAKFLDIKRAKRLNRISQMACSSALLAIEDAKLKNIGNYSLQRCGVFEGTSIGGIQSIFDQHKIYLTEGPQKVNPLVLLSGSLGDSASEISLLLHFQGPSHTICTGSASSSDAIGTGFRAIQNGELDLALVGGAESPLIPEMIQTFERMGVLAKDQALPKTAMRPFDLRRTGFVLGEGAVFLVLENLESAMKRDARIYAELVGYGNSCDSHHPSASDPLGRGMAIAIGNALKEANIGPSDIDYINMHGTATLAGDRSESRAIKAAFGADADRVLCSSTKPVTGHLLGASGAIETAITMLAINHNIIPPTINLHHKDPECDLNYVPNIAKGCNIRNALNLNSGFGGKNAVLVLKSI